MSEEIKQLAAEDFKRMNKEINMLIIKLRYWFYTKYYSRSGIEESIRGFG
jgi:hypothetical protein